jgi:hypothetical protein
MHLPRSKGFAAGLGTLLLLALAADGAPQDRSTAPQRDAALQSAIRDVLAAADESAYARALDSLRALAGPAHATLVPQLLLFSMDATDTREAMAIGALVSALPIPPGDVVCALVPLLESSDEPLRAAVAGVLAQYEGRSVDRGPDFSIYRRWLEAPLDRAKPGPRASCATSSTPIPPRPSSCSCAWKPRTPPRRGPCSGPSTSSRSGAGSDDSASSATASAIRPQTRSSGASPATPLGGRDSTQPRSWSKSLPYARRTSRARCARTRTPS